MSKSIQDNSVKELSHPTFTLNYPDISNISSIDLSKVVFSALGFDDLSSQSQSNIQPLLNQDI